MHLVEILEDHFPTYHIRDASEIISEDLIQHFNQWDKKILKTSNWYPRDKKPLKIAITSGASCPDILVDEVVVKLLNYFDDVLEIDEALKPFVALVE